MRRYSRLEVYRCHNLHLAFSKIRVIYSLTRLCPNMTDISSYDYTLSRGKKSVFGSLKRFKSNFLYGHAECRETWKMLDMALWRFSHMWKPCICNVSRPLYVSVRYLENSFFKTICLLCMALARHFFCLVCGLSLIHISEPTRRYAISYAVFCLKKKMSRNHTE